VYTSCAQTGTAGNLLNCKSPLVRDSLIKRYIDQGADLLPNMYNNPVWQKYCDSIIALCPNTAEAYQLKAVPFIKNGEYEKAMPLYDRAAQVDPGRYTGHRGFIKCLFTKDYESAIADLQKAHQLVPNGYVMDHTFQFYEGLCHLELGNYTPAEQCLKQDIYIQTNGDPKKRPHFNSLLYMGILYYEMGKYDQARTYLLNCLNLYEKLPVANYYLAFVLGRNGNLVAKKQYLEIAKQSYLDGYRMNEDQLYYVNYPHEVKLYEIEEALKGR
jgi:tetratricopeptide (TPR) repeat protein